MLNQEFFVNHLENQIQSLINSGITGVNSVKRIMEEADCTFTSEIPVLYNNYFELVFIKDTLTIEFRTTRSNQVIDNDYMNKMLFINQTQNSISSTIKSIIHFQNIED